MYLAKMKASLLLVLLMTLLGSVAPAQISDDPSAQRISFSAKNEDVRLAVRRLFTLMEVPVRIQPRVVGRVTLDLTDKPFETVLQTMLKQVLATYPVQGGRYEIVPRLPVKGCFSPDIDEEWLESTKIAVDHLGFRYTLKGEVLTKHRIDSGELLARTVLTKTPVGLKPLQARTYDLAKPGDRRDLATVFAEIERYVYFAPDIKGTFTLDPARSRQSNLESLARTLGLRFTSELELEPMVPQVVELMPMEVDNASHLPNLERSLKLSGKTILVANGGWVYRLDTATLAIQKASGVPFTD